MQHSYSLMLHLNSPVTFSHRKNKLTPIQELPVWALTIEKSYLPDKPSAKPA